MTYYKQTENEWTNEDLFKYAVYRYRRFVNTFFTKFKGFNSPDLSAKIHVNNMKNQEDYLNILNQLRKIADRLDIWVELKTDPEDLSKTIRKKAKYSDIPDLIVKWSLNERALDWYPINFSSDQEAFQYMTETIPGFFYQEKEIEDRVKGFLKVYYQTLHPVAA